MRLFSSAGSFSSFPSAGAILLSSAGAVSLSSVGVIILFSAAISLACGIAISSAVIMLSVFSTIAVGGGVVGALSSDGLRLSSVACTLSETLSLVVGS